MPLRIVKHEDASSILEIYAPYVSETSITFEVDIPSREEMLQRIKDVTSVYPWFVYEENGAVKGYAYAVRHGERAAYRWSVDFSVYVSMNDYGKGIGGILYSKLIDVSSKLGYYNAFGIITIPNERSIALHESYGFACNGIKKDCGYKLGSWHDVGIWQLKLREACGKPDEPEKYNGSMGTF